MCSYSPESKGFPIHLLCCARPGPAQHTVTAASLKQRCKRSADVLPFTLGTVSRRHRPRINGRLPAPAPARRRCATRQTRSKRPANQPAPSTNALVAASFIARWMLEKKGQHSAPTPKSGAGSAKPRVPRSRSGESQRAGDAGPGRGGAESSALQSGGCGGGTGGARTAKRGHTARRGHRQRPGGTDGPAMEGEHG